MKSMMRKLSMLFALSFLLVASCDSLLDIEPKQSISSDVATSNASNIQSVLIGTYNSLAGGGFYGGELMVEAGLLANDNNNSEIGFSGTFQTLRQIYEKQIQTTNGQVEDTYEEGFETVNQANVVLNSLSEIDDDSLRTTIQGQALFIRGTALFELVRAYALPYSAGANNPGVPIPLEPNNFENLPRSTVGEVYDQTISDLTQAKSLLIADNGVFASSITASAMLSRIFMQQGDYAAAANEADRVISSGQFELTEDYTEVFNNSSVNTSEDVFAIQVSDQDGANQMNLFYASEANSGRGDISVTDDHIALYDAGDERLNQFYREDSNSSSSPRRTGKWMNQYGNVNIIRLAEMYLNRAEANFRGGTTIGSTPLADINTIRERVDLPPRLTLTIDDIMLERKLELMFEGHLLHDLKRTRQNAGGYAYDNPITVLPIPQREQDINDNL